MGKIFYGWWVVFACFFIGLYVGFVAVFGFTAFFLPIREEFGWSYTEISLAASLRALETGVLTPFAGYVADRFGPKKMLMAGTIAAGTGLCLVSLTFSLATFYASILLVGLGAACCLPTVTTTAVANWFHKKVGKALGLMASGMGASGLMVPLIVRLIDAYGWRFALVLLGLGMWFIGIPMSLVVRDRPEPYGYLPDGGLLEGQARIPRLRNGRGEGLPFRQALRKRGFLFLNMAEILRMMAVMAVAIHAMPYLNSLNISRPTASLVAGAIPLFSIAGRLGFGWLGDLYDKRYVMATSYFMLSMGLITLCFVQMTWGVFFFLILFPPGFGGGMVLRSAILRDFFGRESFGKLMGITMGAASVGEIIGPALAGWTFDRLGNYHPIWLTFCGGIGLAIVLISKIKR